jgi:hypothetical protein
VHLNNPFIVFSFWDVEHLVGKHCEIPIQLVMLWDMMCLRIGVCANISANFLSKKMDGYSLCDVPIPLNYVHGHLKNNNVELK